MGKLGGIRLKTSDETSTQSKLDIPGSNETLYLRYLSFGGFFNSFLFFMIFENLNFCKFHPIGVKFVMGGNIGERTT